MDNIDFTEDEIQEQLVLLGYKNIPKHRLTEFKKGLFHFCSPLLSRSCLKDKDFSFGINRPGRPDSTCRPEGPAL